MKAEFAISEISQALNIPNERTRQWVRRGLIHPNQPSSGQGSKALFSRVGVYGVALLQKLIDRGFKREPASEFVSIFVAQGFGSVVNQICFWSTMIGEERVVNAHFMAGGGELTIKIESSKERHKYPFSIGGSGGLEPKEIQAWEDIFVVNIDRLRHEVDMALEGLD